MGDGPFTIGELARGSGVKVETVRHDETLGLLSQPPRTEGGHRRYSGEHLRRLVFIRRSRDA